MRKSIEQTLSTPFGQNDGENSDSELREEAILVRDALLRRGLETPMIAQELPDEEKRSRIEGHFQEVMEILGLDLRDDSFMETPQRIARMYVDEIFSGLDYRNFPKLTVIENKMQVDEMIKVCDIDLSSTCEHHFVTIDGSASVAYIPRSRLVGLSKVSRIVRFFAQRPQVQERLTEQVLLALQTLLQSEDVAVSIRAVHYCMKARGVRDTNSFTSTTALGGVFKTQPETRREFLMGAN